MFRQSNNPEVLFPEYMEVVDSGLDQQKAQAAWVKLQEQTKYIDQTLKGNEYTFYCVKNLNDKIGQNHYDISIFPANSDVNEAEKLTDLIFIQLTDGAFAVAQDKDAIDEGFATRLLPDNINSLLADIVVSTRESSPEEAETVGLIQKTRESFNKN